MEQLKTINTLNYFINSKINKVSIEKYINIHATRKENETTIIEVISKLIQEKIKIKEDLILKSNLKDTIKLIVTDQFLSECKEKNFDEELSKKLKLINL